MKMGEFYLNAKYDKNSFFIESIFDHKNECSLVRPPRVKFKKNIALKMRTEKHNDVGKILTLTAYNNDN